MKKTLLTFLISLLSYASFAQLVQLGSGTSSSAADGGAGSASVYNYFSENRKIQMIYTAAELNAVGINGPATLNSIAWYVVQGFEGTLVNYTIKAANTTVDTWASADPFIENNLSTVYSQNVVGEATTDYWKTFTFSTPFVWNGTDNLLIEVCFGTNLGNATSGSVRQYAVSGENRLRGRRSSSTNYCNDYTGGTRTTNKPQCQMLFSVASGCFAPSTQPAANVNQSSATIIWTPPALLPQNGYEWELRTTGMPGSGAIGLVDSGLLPNSENQVEVSNLTNNTNYLAYVRSVCGNDDFSAWSVVSEFTTFTPPAFSFSKQINTSTDDAEEKFDGSYTTATSSDLELVFDTWNNQGLQKVGLRFPDINIPNNATITNAYIQFTADGASSGDVNLSISGEKSTNAVTFVQSGTPSNSISSRPLTDASISWNNIPNWSNNEAGINQRTPDISVLVTEIISQNGWVYGNPLTFIITGDGNSSVLRRAFSFDGSASKAAVLVIEYESNYDIDLTLTEIVQPSNNIAYTNTNIPLSVKVNNLGNQNAANFSVSCFVDDVLHETLDNTSPIIAGQEVIFDFSIPLSFAVSGTYTIAFEVNIADDENIANNQISKTIQVVDQVSDLFFSQNQHWKYYDGATTPGSNWNTNSFDDNLWAMGLGQFGFGEGDEQILLNAGQASYYFRKNVNVDDVSSLNDVYFHLIHDDAAVIYINGVEAFRTELMPNGMINHTTTARQRINHDIENTYITYKIDKSYFVNGNNLIAISMHNVATNDDDLSFDCYVTPTHTYSQDGPYVYYENDQVIVKSVTPTGLVQNTYTDIQGQLLTCHIPYMNKSFSFTLKPNLVNDPSIYENTPSKFFAISDFDGNMSIFYNALLNEGVIDEDFNWTYDNGHLVVNGDVFDRDNNVTECLWLIYKLESEAEAQGGKVHYIIGNHEMFCLRDDWRYVEAKYFSSAQLMDKRMPELYNNDTEIGRWLRTKNIITKLGDYVLVHAGVSPQVSALNLSFDQMNTFGRTRMNNDPCTGDCATVVHSTHGLYWYRGLANQELSQSQVDDIAANLGVQRMVIGHTKGTNVRSLYDGKVVAIDINHQNNLVNGFVEALQQLNGCFNRFNTTIVAPTTITYTELGMCDVLSIDEFLIGSNNQVVLYPNPTSDAFDLHFSDKQMDNNISLTIYDLSGKVILHVNQVEDKIDVSNLAKGLYFVNVHLGNQSIIQKLIVK